MSHALHAHAQAKALPHLAENDPQAAALGYRHDAKKVDAKKFANYKLGQDCDDCSQWEGKKAEAWAACKIFPGKAVNAKGWCAAFQPKKARPAPPARAPAPCRSRRWRSACRFYFRPRRADAHDEHARLGAPLALRVAALALVDAVRTGARPRPARAGSRPAAGGPSLGTPCASAELMKAAERTWSSPSSHEHVARLAHAEHHAGTGEDETRAFVARRSAGSRGIMVKMGRR